MKSIQRRNSGRVITLLMLFVAVRGLGIDFKKIGEKVGGVVKVVTNPVGAAHEEAAKIVAKEAGINPDVAGKVANPVGQVIDHAPKAAIQMLQTKVDHFVSLKNSVLKGDVGALAVNELRRTVHESLPPPAALEAAMPYVMLPAMVLPRDTMMEAPQLTLINPALYDGDPVTYVNGMATPKRAAELEALSLSLQIQRPVQLLYNGTNGVERDIAESIIDRFSLLFAPGKPEFNSTTKQLAHLIYHADRPVSIVSHSQGAVVVRNALMIADRYRSVRHNVAWVATGCPLNPSEIYPEPVRFRILNNPADTAVVQMASLEFDPDMLKKIAPQEAHAFILSYSQQVSNSDLFGKNGKRNEALEALEAPWAGTWSCNGNCSISFRSAGLRINEGPTAKVSIIRVANEHKAIGRASFVSPDRIRVDSGEGWTAGVEGALRGDEIHWSTGSVWKRVPR